jgi:hypothetical protein
VYDEDSTEMEENVSYSSDVISTEDQHNLHTQLLSEVPVYPGQPREADAPHQTPGQGPPAPPGAPGAPADQAADNTGEPEEPEGPADPGEEPVSPPRMDPTSPWTPVSGSQWYTPLSRFPWGPPILAASTTPPGTRGPAGTAASTSSTNQDQRDTGTARGTLRALMSRTFNPADQAIATRTRSKTAKTPGTGDSLQAEEPTPPSRGSAPRGSRTPRGTRGLRGSGTGLRSRLLDEEDGISGLAPPPPAQSSPHHH